MGELVHLGIDDRIGTITLDSQHNRNALSRRLVEELGTAVDRAVDDDVRAIVIRHEGPAFCAGADLKERAGDAGRDDGSTATRSLVRIMTTLMDTGRPTIAAVEGAVRAGGIGLMAACDLVVIRHDVTFALTEVRIGVAPAIISVPILRRVPPSRIAAAMLTGDPFDATEAREIGLVTHVSDDVPATVAALLDGIRAGAPAAVAATKRLLHHVPTLPREVALEEMQALSQELFAGPDAAEGMAAFREKRPPSWAGSPPRGQPISR